ncbi:AraC family transcriptional regulator [Aeromicrobium fastidiosum]|uniref:AraC family transcriptional regulator n=1 Tax=Aeromicrobium fastidiosum TaxID=52699 RepID=A0A641ALJ1_9ACTN|nr:AraC family transcriptional regulator [Aeromicrobium fastidiosum]KAA1378144.1 AraC family transcriptional regulator [Aeromicrobium fastidiosum]MBP2389055.1 methylphosphotriester-DNA--protein-cysteine methyltransferase [Aeromicrobium fastidiosum]
MVRATTPLGCHGVLRTTDVHDARESIAASLAPHGLDVLDQPQKFRALHNAATLDRLSLHYIDYGAEVEVTADRMDFHLIQIPLAGVTAIQAGEHATTVTARRAVVIAPGAPVRMRYSAGNPRLLVRIDPELLQDRLVLAAAGGLVVPWGPGSLLDVSGEAGQSWRRLVEIVVTDLGNDRGLMSSPRVAKSLEIAVVDGLIASLAAPPEDSPPPGAVHERVVRRAARLIDEHCAEPLGTADIAEAVGVSIRALQAGFQAHLGTTPMAYVRRARLVRVRESLTDGTARSVTEAAHRWGVTHLGRLSGDYRAAFGEAPIDTLRRVQ